MPSGELHCGDCEYGQSATNSLVTCEILGVERSMTYESTCQVCRDGLVRESHLQEPQRDLIRTLRGQLADLEDEERSLWGRWDIVGERAHKEALDLVRDNINLIIRDLARAERALERDLLNVIRYLWPRTKGGENRHCPECGWGRLDISTKRCPIHMALLVLDAT